MYDDSCSELIEDTINGFDIYIEPNPDQYRGGYVWSVSKEDVELDSGLVFSINDALSQIHNSIFN